jgi:hypothetical protein
LLAERQNGELSGANSFGCKINNKDKCDLGNSCPNLLLFPELHQCYKSYYADECLCNSCVEQTEEEKFVQRYTFNFLPCENCIDYYKNKSVKYCFNKSTEEGHFYCNTCITELKDQMVDNVFISSIVKAKSMQLEYDLSEHKKKTEEANKCKWLEKRIIKQSLERKRCAKILCNEFNKIGNCKKGINCWYSHD